MIYVILGLMKGIKSILDRRSRDRSIDVSPMALIQLLGELTTINVIYVSYSAGLSGRKNVHIASGGG